MVENRSQRKNNKKKFSKISTLIKKEIKVGTFPGAVIGIVNDKKIIFQGAFGQAQLEPETRPMNLETVFDLASLTKAIATTSAIIKLVETGRISIWNYINDFFPDVPETKKEITVYHLLTHTSGYQPVVQLWEKELGYDEKVKYILNLPLENETGEIVNYSDLNFILLGEIVRRVTGDDLQEFTRKNIFSKLGMKKTTFNPLQNLENVNRENFAATEYCDWREEIVTGEVHDENACSLGGISGHAGLFSTIGDLCRFALMLLNKGKFKETRIFSEPTVTTMRKNWTQNLNKNRALGWDKNNNIRSSGGIFISDKAFGHTGFTGTSFWVDPEYKISIIFLTNRVHPSRENTEIISLRPRLHNLIMAELSK